jgi:hypothetical protein
MHRFRRIALSANFVVACLAVPGPRAAHTLEYAIDLPPDQVISYVVEIEVREPGRMVVDAEWSSTRMLTLRLEQPDGTAVRRTGPPPLKLEFDVEPEALEDEGRWVLRVRGLPSRQAASGRVLVALPDPSNAPTELATDLAPRPTVAEPDPPWEHPRAIPRNASDIEVRVYAATERFRQAVVDPGSDAPDTCRWQSGMLRYLARTRDRLSDSGVLPADETRRILGRMAGAVADVEEFRTSDDPLLSPPAASDRMKYRAWQVVFHRETAPVRDDLDDLLHAVQNNRSKELDAEDWPGRFLSCLIACERHFEERRARRDMAANRKLAEDQWERMLAAGRALSIFASVE